MEFRKFRQEAFLAPSVGFVGGSLSSALAVYDTVKHNYVDAVTLGAAAITYFTLGYLFASKRV